MSRRANWEQPGKIKNQVAACTKTAKAVSAKERSALPASSWYFIVAGCTAGLVQRSGGEDNLARMQISRKTDHEERRGTDPYYGLRG